MLSTPGVTHVAGAFDHVIESFRNDLYAGYKTGAGVDPVLLAQFERAEEAVRALGVAVWPMVEFEADDALATAAARFATQPGSSRSCCARRTRTPRRPCRGTDRLLGPPAGHRRGRGRGGRESTASRRPRCPIGWRSSGTRRTAIPASRAGAPSRPRPCWPGTGA